MKALILDGSKENDETLKIARETIENKLHSVGWEVNSFVLRDIEIAPCLGYFSCWIKTPGVCVIKDAIQDITREAARSDLWFFLTPVTFGGYSANLKKAVDRIISFGLPFFVTRTGELHHPPRYAKRAGIVSIGLLKQPNHKTEKTFSELTARNAINFASSLYKSEILLNNQSLKEIEVKIEKILSKTKVLSDE